MTEKFCVVAIIMSTEAEVDAVNRALTGLQRQGVDVRRMRHVENELLSKHEDKVH